MGTISQTMEELRVRHEEDYGKPPAAFLLGPREALLLRNEFHPIMFDSTPIGEISEFAGVMVFLKREPGVSLAYPVEMAGRLMFEEELTSKSLKGLPA